MKASIITKIIIIFVAVFMVTLASTAVVSSLFFTREYSQAVTSKAFMIGRSLKYQLDRLLKFDIPLNNLVGFEDQCQDIINNYEDISCAMVVGLDGIILFHNNPKKHGELIPDHNLLKNIRNKKETQETYREQGQKYLGIIIPVTGAHQENIGAVIICFPENLISQKTTRMVAYSAGVAIIFMGAGVVLFMALLNVWVTRPLRGLLGVINTIRSGGADKTQLVEIKSQDEFGELGAAFNEMVLQLRESHEKLSNYAGDLELKVQESTAHLQEANEKLKQDIAERLKAEAALMKSEEKYRALLNHAGDAILLADTQGNLLEANRKMEKLLGYTPAEFLTLNFVQIHPAEERRQAWTAFQEVLRQGAVTLNNSRLWRRDGREVPVEMTANVVEYGGQAVVQGIFRDISARLKAEAEHLQISKLESLGLLAGGIAHDFNNILTGIMGNIGLALLNPQVDRDSQTGLAEAEQACRRAQMLAHQLLTFAKGGLPVKKLTRLEQIIRESANLILSGSKARARFLFPADLWLVEADEGQITQIISNLLINADQAMPAGGVVTVTAENCRLEPKADLPLTAGKYVKITVADEGVGIPRQVEDRIFDPYFTTKENGTGLGLASVFAIMRNHGGYITVESAAGAGAAFHLYFPATEGEKVPEERGPGDPIRGQGKILIMDDEKIIRDVLSRILARIGYESDCAQDGAEAVELYQKAREAGRPYAAMISDLTVPGGMGGKEALEILRALDPHIKAIVSSGYSDDPIMANYRAYGFQGVIAKPYKIAELSRVLHMVIEGPN